MHLSAALSPVPLPGKNRTTLINVAWSESPSSFVEVSMCVRTGSDQELTLLLGNPAETTVEGTTTMYTNRSHLEDRRRRSKVVRLIAGMGTAVAVAGLVVPALPAPSSAAVAEADLETTILRISGSALTSGSTVPVGRTLTPMRLVVSDPETAANDALSLVARNSFLRTAAEPATFRVNGTVVATSVPDFWSVNLQTNSGAAAGVVFTSQRVSYFIPRLNVGVGSATSVSAASPIGTGFIGSLLTYQYGLFPVGAVVRGGAAYLEVNEGFGQNFVSRGAVRFRVYDADDRRSSADTRGEELVLAERNGQAAPSPLTLPGQTVSATVSLRNGAIITVRGIQFVANGAYGYAERTWMFDHTALGSAGATVADITAVIASSPTSHNLLWSQLGFSPI